MSWYKIAQTENIYKNLQELGIKVNEDGTLDIYSLNENGKVVFDKFNHVGNVDKAINQQYIIKEATEGELNKLLAFVDDLVLMVEKMNNFPVLDIPNATGKKEKEKEKETIVTEPIYREPIEDVLEEDQEIEEIEEDKIEQPYPYIPQEQGQEKKHPEYGFWYYPFDPNDYDEKTQEQIEEELGTREDMERNLFTNEDNVPPPPSIPENKQIIKEIEEDAQNIQEQEEGAVKTLSENDINYVINMIRVKYIAPLENTREPIKLKIRGQFEKLLNAYQEMKFGETYDVINMVTRVVLERELRDKYEPALNLLKNRISILEEFHNLIVNGQIFYGGELEDIGAKMQGYIVQPHSPNVYIVTKPNRAAIYYTDIANNTCTCPWGRKVSPYKYFNSACKHFKWIYENILNK